MISIPFIYFTCILLYQLKRKKWSIDIASFILIIFATSAFFSILIDVFGQRSMDTHNYVISPIACFAYCSLITLCVWPFMRYSNLQIKKISPIRNASVLKYLAIFFFLFTLLNMFMSYESILKILSSDDFGQIRKAHHDGLQEMSWLATLPFSIRFPFTIVNLLLGCSWILVFLAFFIIIVQKCKFRYGFYYMFASISGILDNILIAGRSAMIFWMIGFVGCYIFFRPYTNLMIKKKINFLFIIIGVLFFLYLSAITISRFGERDAGEITGTQGGLISYMGQSYINFCYFFDTYDCPMPTLQTLFPLTYKLQGSIDGAGQLQQVLTFMSKKEVGVFYTFIGHIIITTFNAFGIAFCFFYSFISSLSVRKVKKKVISVSNAYIYLLLSSVMFLGLFSYYYSYASKTVPAIFYAIILYQLQIKEKKNFNNIYNHKR